MKFRVYDKDKDFDDFFVNGTQLINYCRELRGENSNQEYPDPKSAEEAIRYLVFHCNIGVEKL